MKIIGINDGHNATACLLVNGEIRGMLQEERPVGEKNIHGFPKLSVEKLLDMNGMRPDDVDLYAYSFLLPVKGADRHKRIRIYQDAHRPISYVKSWLSQTPLRTYYHRERIRDRERAIRELGSECAEITQIEHHLAHAASAYYGCPWVKSDEKVLVLTQDGAGDGLSATVNIGHKGRIERIAEITKADSLGRIYANVTCMMGMVPLEHEYKLMGMAPFAPEAGRERSADVFRQFLRFSTSKPLVWMRPSGIPPMQMLIPRLQKDLQYHRFDWIAAGLQQFTEEMLVQWVKNCIRHTGINKIVLAGGTFMNVKANQRIAEIPEVHNIFIVPSCGDESSALGAAYVAQRNQDKSVPLQPIRHMYLGPDETSDHNSLEAIEQADTELPETITWEKVDDIDVRIGSMIADGEIVARCRGPVEFGARALGNRSILADASKIDNVRVINDMIKNRDFWMPFAPVMLPEMQTEYFQNPKGLDASFMILTFDTTDRFPEFIGGVQQKDFTARPQVVDRDVNPGYYALLKEYHRKTGRGVLINTSFNLHGLPLVYGPKEAMFVLMNSGLRHVAVGNYLVSKK